MYILWCEQCALRAKKILIFVGILKQAVSQTDISGLIEKYYSSKTKLFFEMSQSYDF